MSAFKERKKQLNAGGGTGESVFSIRKAQLTPLSTSQKEALQVEQSDMAQMDAAQRNAVLESPDLMPQDEQAKGNAVTRTLDKVFKENPVMRVVNYIPQKIAEYSVPDAPMIGRREDGSYGNLPGTNARQDYIERNPTQSSGNETYDEIGEVIGKMIGPLVSSRGTGTGSLVNLTEQAFTKYAPNLTSKLGSTAGGRIGLSTAKYAPAGAVENVEATLGTEVPTAENLATNAALGAAFGGALGAAGRGVKELVPKITKGSNLGISAFSKKPGAYDNLKTDTKSQIVTSIKKPESSTRSKLTTGYMQLTDDLYTLKDFDKYAEDVLGDIKNKDKTYVTALTSRGSDIISKQILTENMVDMNGNVVGSSLKERLSKLPKNKQVDFEDYMINKHAITRYERGEKVFDDSLNWTPEAGAKKIAEYEHQYPQFKEMADQYYDFLQNMAKHWLVDGDLIPDNVFKAWLRDNPTYVPNDRQFSELEKTGKGIRAKGGFANQSSTVKKYSKVGSQRKIISPIESTIKNVDNMVKAAKRNMVVKNLVNIIQKDPEAFKEWAEIVPIRHEAKATSLKEVNEILKEGGIDALVNRFNDDFEIALKKSPHQGLDKDNIIRAMINGEPVHVRVNDPQLLEALSGLNPQAQHTVVKAMSNVTRTVKLLTTGANPIFSVTRSMLRDIPLAFVASKSTNNPLVFGRDLIEGFVSALSNGKLYQSFKNVGGGHASAVAADRNLLAQSKREILGNKNARDRIASVFSGIENFNNALEAAPRLGEFKRLTKGTDDFESRIKGLYEANDVTVNFKRRGKVSPALDPFILYWNASVQGLDKAMRIMKDNPVQASIKAVSAMTAPMIVLYAINHNNQKYQELNDYTKDNFYLIPTGNEENPFFRIPVPQVLGVPFKSLPERALRAWADEDPDAFNEFATTIINQFLPAGVSGITKDIAVDRKIPDPTSDTILGPFSDIRANKNFVGGSIVPGYLEGASPRLQYDSRTSEISKFIGDKTNLSPKQLDYLIKSYSGVIGQIGIPLTAQGSTLGDTLARQVTVDPVFSNNLMDKFYKNKEKLDRANEDFQQTGEMPKEFNNELRLYFGRVARSMSDIRKQMREVETDKTLTSEQKKETNRELQKLLNNLAREANEQMKQPSK